ncbi:conserved hypothetical protein [Bacillus mycoides]|uniref:Uncharacterized protein n=1 Tax=Bacillus mycoides TaxID=1405 RepID=A0A653ZZJ7_BACMY|nr:hypothetical protein [Bacillus mycoides]VXC60589.1 conserved hypothetical protein [Bacillus mycoides]
MARPHNPTGGPRTPQGKAKALKNLTPGNYIHGIYKKTFREEWTPEERAYYNDFMSHYREEYQLSKMDEDMLDRYLVAMIKTRRVDSVGMKYAINRPASMLNFDQEAIRMAQELGLSRRYRLSKGNSENKTDVNWNLLFDGANE